MPAQSLADFFGTSDAPPREPEVDYAALTGQEFARKFVSSQEFYDYLIRELRLGELPAGVITNLMNRAWGKEPEKIEFEDKTKSLEALTPAELNQRLDAIAAILSAQDA